MSTARLGLALEKLMAAGGVDVHYVPCFMRKNVQGCAAVICRHARGAVGVDYFAETELSGFGGSSWSGAFWSAKLCGHVACGTVEVKQASGGRRHLCAGV